MNKVLDRNIGDSVWLMFNDKAVSGTIKKIMYTKSLSCLDFETINENVRYYIDVNTTNLQCFTADEIHTTKEELIESL